MMAMEMAMMMHMIMQSVGDLQSLKINLHIIAYASFEQLTYSKLHTVRWIV